MRRRPDQIQATSTFDPFGPQPYLQETGLPEAAAKPYVAPRVITGLLRFIEMALIAAFALVQVWIYPGFGADGGGYYYESIIAFASLTFIIVAQFAGLYQLEPLLNPFRNLPKLALAWFAPLALVALGLLAFQMGDEVSRLWFSTWSILGMCWVATVRAGMAAVVRYYNANGQLNRRAVIVGGGHDAELAIETLQNSQDTGVTLVGIFDDRQDDRSPGETRGLRKLGGIEDLVGFVRRTRVDTLIVTLPIAAESRLLQIVSRLWVLPVDIKLSAHAQKLRYRPRAYSHIGNLALLDVFDKPLGDWGPLLKAIEDRVLAALALTLLAPVMALVALAIKLDSKGPVLFKQKRYGFNNELIEVYKFRSMYTEATDADARKLVTKGDPRVTRVGRFIRKTTLDELPQLFNVLRGDLSLVGPRPHATRASAAGTLYENAVQSYFARHRVKPGMTGWAQINGWRGETDTEEKIRNRVEHDLYYIENWSLTFDLYILARTPFALFNTASAY